MGNVVPRLQVEDLILLHGLLKADFQGQRVERSDLTFHLRSWLADPAFDPRTALAALDRMVAMGILTKDGPYNQVTPYGEMVYYKNCNKLAEITSALRDLQPRRK